MKSDLDWVLLYLFHSRMWGVLACVCSIGLGWFLTSTVEDCPEIITHPDNEDSIKAIIPTYRVPRVFTSSLLMLIAGSLSVSRLPPNVSFKREEVELEDGFIYVDWYITPQSEELEKENSPIIIALHGITGHAQENYMRDLCKQAALYSFRIVCINARGAGGTKLASAKGFHAGKSDDFRSVVEYVNSKFPQSILFGVGFSLGANVLGKYLGEWGMDCLMQGAVLFSNPCDLHVSSEKMTSTWLHRNLLNARITDNLKKWMQPHRSVFGKIVDFAMIDAATTIREFDEHYILPVFPEFSDVDDYYTKSSSCEYISQVKIPLLVVHSKDDPICPISAISNAVVDEASNITICRTKYGSHVCWLNSLNVYNRSSWAEPVATSFFRYLQETNK